jgi:hypothetical protein
MRKQQLAVVLASIGATVALSLLGTACSGDSSSPSGTDQDASGDCCTDGSPGDSSRGEGGSAGDGPGSTDGSPDADSGPPGDPTGVVAVSAATFLGSLGVNTHIDQGYDATQYVKPLQYTGIRNIRDGERNLSSTIMVHQQTGILVDLGAGADLTGILAAGKTLAGAAALLSFEGANEPNNFPITYNGQQGGGSGTWVPVAQYQKDLYAAVKGDPTLKKYPIFSVSEDGAETDDVGLQFLTIPNGSGIAMPDGTIYADYANPHNYVIGNAGTYNDNQAWGAADPTLNGGVGGWDGLYGEYGLTWRNHYKGNSNADLQTLPRVTTETGWDSVNNPGGEQVQGVVLVNTYLAQFKRGWTYTFIYELVDEQGSTGEQGIYHKDFTPKPCATYIHDLTTVLADMQTIANPGKLDYSIANEPATVHDLLLQKSSGTFELVVWDERASATDNVTVDLGKMRATVNLYDVTVGTTPTKALSNVSSVPLSLSDHAVIVEVVE